MERTMSVEERIRRAEEIYNRRNGQFINTSSNYTKHKKRNNVKKMIMQIFMCLIIYLAFYVFTNSDYIFSEDFLNQIKSNFNQDSKIYSIYLNAKSYINEKLSSKSDQTVENEQSEEENKTDGIGGAEENVTIKEDNKKEEKQAEDKTSKMEKDAQKIKKEVSFIVPVKGRISSTFGWRTPTTNTVPKYHTGIDIAAKEGTIIKSATDGKVILVSSEGDYGKHYQIQSNDITIVYAHCSKLYLKQGDKVKQGDKIAEVGSTGNSTGPHLHFEIRKGKELIDPELILNI